MQQTFVSESFLDDDVIVSRRRGYAPSGRRLTVFGAGEVADHVLLCSRHVLAAGRRRTSTLAVDRGRPRLTAKTRRPCDGAVAVKLVSGQIEFSERMRIVECACVDCREAVRVQLNL